MPPTQSLIWCRGWFGRVTQFGRRPYFFQRVFSALKFTSSVVQVPEQPHGEERGRTEGRWDSSFGVSGCLGNSNLQSPCTESTLEYHGPRGTFCLALHLGQSLLTCPSPAGFRRGLCPANVLVRVKISSISHLVAGKKLYHKSAHLEVTKRLQNPKVHGFPLWGRTRYRKTEMETR